MHVGLVQLLAYWYSHQKVIVVWLNTRSTPFAISNGTKQLEFYLHICSHDTYNIFCVTYLVLILDVVLVVWQ